MTNTASPAHPIVRFLVFSAGLLSIMALQLVALVLIAVLPTAALVASIGMGVTAGLALLVAGFLAYLDRC